jgi:hypothetical protein
MIKSKRENGDTRVVEEQLQIWFDRKGWIELGWSAHTAGGATWLTPGAPVEALNVPSEVGERAVVSLSAAGVWLPVINLPGPPDRWALLIQPFEGHKGEILATFAGRDVGYAYVGRHEGRASEWSIDLPPTQHPGHDALTWICSPDIPLPPADSVLRALAGILKD